MARLTIGWRLTLWYGAFLLVALAGFGVVVYTTFARNLLSEVDRALDEELVELALAVGNARNQPELLAVLERDFGGHAFYEIQVTTRTGQAVFTTPGLDGRPLVLPAPSVPPVRDGICVTVSAAANRYRVRAREVTGPDGPLVVAAADSLALYDRERRELLAVLLGAVPLVVTAALAGGWWISRRALAPIDRMTSAALEITSARLDRRVAVPDSDDELRRLAGAFNAMIARLERSFDDMRRFTADAAHELRTPLAVLRNEAEVTLRAGRSEDDYRRVLENQLEEIARLTRLADQLLFLCREDAGLAAARSEPVRIDLLLIELVERLQVAAQARGVLLEPAVIPECTVASDSDRLRRLFFNLLDNALKYTPAGGRVRVLGRIVGENLEVRVEDSGIGVSSDNLPHLFERFFRVDPARNGESGGSGLGLAICRAIVEAHRGQICAESAAAGGLRMIVTLPARPSEEPPVPAAASNRSDPSRRIARIPDEAPVHSVTM